MIETLRIRDFALVDTLTLELEPGFAVLTGETGAGKSILLQALGLLLGDRANRDGVRAGAKQARVEGLFQPAGGLREALVRILENAGILWDAEEPLVLARTVGADGRSRAYVNGALVPVSLLAQIGARLVEVSSQHQHQGLLKEETHLDLLDGSLDLEGTDALQAYGRTYRAWISATEEVLRLETLRSQAEERADFLRHQAEEIRAARLEPDEDSRLRAERDLLLHAGKLLEAYSSAEEEIYSGAQSALDRLSKSMKAVEVAVRRDPEASEILDILGEARISLEEAAHRLRDRQTALEANPRRLEALEDRLEILRRLERKHGTGVATVLQRLEAMEAELWDLENTELALSSARSTLSRCAADLETRAQHLCEARKRAAQELERCVNEELEALAFRRSSFRVELSPAETGAKGRDSVRFVLAANPGEPPRPLARIASGGELSRLLLALKNALRDSGVATLVFDEVDAGVSGVTADAVADRLVELADSCQIVCITHLPQIAARSTRHYRVEKSVRNARTFTRVRRLDLEERIEELARLLGGRHITEATRDHARELIGRYAV